MIGIGSLKPDSRVYPRMSGFYLVSILFLPVLHCRQSNNATDVIRSSQRTKLILF